MDWCTPSFPVWYMRPKSRMKAGLSSPKGSTDVAARRRVNSIVSLPTNHFADFVAADRRDWPGQNFKIEVA